MTNKFFSKLVFFVLAISLLFINKQWRWSESRGASCIEVDGNGYYAYLPAIFIYHDLHFGFTKEIEKKYGSTGKSSDFVVRTNDLSINKYYSGVALLLSPFFLIALLISKIFGASADGYSLIFQGAVCLGAAFYFLLGLFFIRKTLLLYKISEKNSAITILFIGLGTNLLYYTAMEPSMSHVYSFAMVSIFCYAVKQFFLTESDKIRYLISFALGVIVLIRPSNIIVFASVPFLAGDYYVFKRGISSFIKITVTFLPVILICACIIIIQPVIWYVQIGKIFIWSYPGEKFNFLKPEFFNILFSYRKGLFVYTPMIALSLLGLVSSYKRSIFEFVSFIFFFILVTYVLSSWWSWWYGGSFGLRSFIDFFPIFAISLGTLIHSTSKWILKTGVLLVGFLFVWLNYIQSYQYSTSILKWDEMNKDSYWQLFLKTQQRYRGTLTTIPQLLDSSTVKNVKVYAVDFDSTENFPPPLISNEHAYSGTHSTMANSANRYSAGFAERVSNLTSSKKVYFRVSCMAYLENVHSDAQLVVSFEKNKKAILWKSTIMNEYITSSGIWQKIYNEGMVPAFSVDDTLKVYVLNSKKKVFADDFRIELFELK